MAQPDHALPDTGAGSPGLLSELLVEAFIARGAAYHDDVQEAADEFRELFASFGILTEENEALIRGKAARVAQRAGRTRRRAAANDEAVRRSA